MKGKFSINCGRYHSDLFESAKFTTIEFACNVANRAQVSLGTGIMGGSRPIVCGRPPLGLDQDGEFECQDVYRT